MKIRLDFVTNSSSSSFVCYGVNKDEIKMTDETYLKFFHEYFKRNKKWLDINPDKMTDKEKIEYIKDDDYELYNVDLISIGGQEHDEVGITVGTLTNNFPDEKIGDIEKIVARELNKAFGTNFTENDINYFESGWYDG